MKAANPLRSGLVALCVLCAAAQSRGQGTITFDGPPVQPPGADYSLRHYFEQGMSFASLSESSSFGRVWPPSYPGDPDNGTAFLRAAMGDSLSFRLISGSTFNVVSVDLAEYSTAFQTPLTVHFVGKESGSHLNSQQLR